MRQQVSPAVVGVIIAVVVIAVILWGYKAMTGHMPGQSASGGNPYASGKGPPTGGSGMGGPGAPGGSMGGSSMPGGSGPGGSSQGAPAPAGGGQ